MPETQLKQETLNSQEIEAYGSRPDSPRRRSAAAMLVELADAFVNATSKGPSPGLCSQCRGYRDPRSSTAQSPHVFCSAECERDFVRTALASVTLEDCLRIQHRLESLLLGTQAPAMRI